MTLERIVEVWPAYDRRNPDPEKSFGIGAVMLAFILRGPKGATQFTIYTGWYLPHVALERGSNAEVFANDLGYHSPVPTYDGQRSMGRPCPVLGTDDCYYDGSSLAAADLFAEMLREGHAAIWRRLEAVYRDRFGPLPEVAE